MTKWKSKDRKNKIRKDAKWNHLSAIPIIKNLVAIGLTEAEIGLILEIAPSTLASWKQRYPDIFNANLEGKKVLKGLLCAEMFRSAIGYDYEEVEKTYKMESIKDENGNNTGKTKKTLVGEKRKTKHQHGNDPLKMFLANNLLPEVFPRDGQTTHNNTLNLIANVETKQLEAFAGKLIELSRKKVESREVSEPNK